MGFKATIYQTLLRYEEGLGEKGKLKLVGKLETKIMSQARPG